jgi:hypothetical protein
LKQQSHTATKHIVSILVFCLTVLATPVAAQDAPTLSNLEIALWPEYDRPEVLVIYRGLFTPDTALPVPVEIRIPARVGQPTAVAYVDEAGQRFNQAHTTRIDGEQLVVSFDLATPAFQLEYYDELAADSTGAREYTFTYVADYPSTELNLEFQVPSTATEFALDPAADSVVVEGDGLTYHLVQRSAVPQGGTESWTFAYQKDNEELTASAFMQAPTPAPATSQAPAVGSDSSTALIFLVAFVALVGVGAGAFWLGRRAQSIPETAPPPKRRKRRGSGQGPRPQPERRAASNFGGALFCHKCGTQLRPDADFCHRCGQSTRRE